MKFVSTRDSNRVYPINIALSSGLAADGGLYFPTQLPIIDINELQEHDFISIQTFLLALFFDDLSLDFKAIKKAYQDKFEAKAIIPMVHLNKELSILECYYGPSYSFKDIALTALPFLLSTSLAKNQQSFILTATSGDTGSATLEAFKNVPQFKVGIFYPFDKVSVIQKTLMQQSEGDNVFVWGIDGNFDDAQQGVKKILENKAAIDSTLTSANSINIGRLLAQVAYYFYSYVQLVDQYQLKPNQSFNVVVPSGNFGNILAGYIAKRMGCPIDKLVCASNQNDVLAKFIQTGIYDINRELTLTSSPSMDILVSSNIERLLYLLTDQSSDQIKTWMNDLKSKGFYQIDAITLEKLQKDFIGESASESEVAHMIKATFEQHHLCIDPHTAVAKVVYEKVKMNIIDNGPTVILATASPYKFASTIIDALGLPLAQDPLDDIFTLSTISHTKIPKGLETIKTKPIRFDQVVTVDDMLTALRRVL